MASASAVRPEVGCRVAPLQDARKAVNEDVTRIMCLHTAQWIAEKEVWEVECYAHNKIRILDVPHKEQASEVIACLIATTCEKGGRVLCATSPKYASNPMCKDGLCPKEFHEHVDVRTWRETFAFAAETVFEDENATTINLSTYAVVLVPDMLTMTESNVCRMHGCWDHVYRRTFSLILCDAIFNVRMAALSYFL